MAWIELTLEGIPRTGGAVNPDEVFLVRGKVVNNLPWGLKKCEWHLVSTDGPIQLFPGGTALPKIVKDDDIPPAGDSVQDFTLECTGHPGPGKVCVEFKWVLDDTALTFPVKDCVDIAIFPG